MNPNADPKIEDELADDIALENAGDEGERSVEHGDATDQTEADKAAQMVEVQKEAAEERKEGGYQ